MSATQLRETAEAMITMADELESSEA